MTGQPVDPFDLGPDAAGLAGVARELEAFADETRLAPSADLADRIMAAIATEPVPTPPVTFLHAIGALALMDAWRAWRLNLRVVLGGGQATGRLRMQALAVVVVAALLLGVGGTTVAVGAAQLVQALVTPSVTAPDTTPLPTGPDVSPSLPTRSTTSPDVSPSPDTSSGPDESEAPGESEEPGDSSEPGESGDDSSGSSRTATPRPAKTQRPATPEPDDTDHPDATDSPNETQTTEPDDTPMPTSNSGGSGSGSAGADFAVTGSDRES